MTPFFPDHYRLLNTLSGLPIRPERALELAGLKQREEPMETRHRNLLYQTTRMYGTAQWVAWGGGGLVLTGYGEVQLEDFLYRYGSIPKTLEQEAAARARHKERAENVARREAEARGEVDDD
ncbi:hypothetical protein [Deinococcus ruber]|uniref:Uncharacterized protein n=1 Tax=Deinococcus ruber TaxID=1848197 RepID=A0A918C811_9DEIO|nr:hypothetical protein [Deinococcus ruber]GGR11523.1 hypothetical protein GCM10008957_25540 [Deinococcus ruber]